MKTRHFALVSVLTVCSAVSACKKGDSGVSAAASAQAVASAPAAQATAALDTALSDLEGVIGLSVKSKKEAMNLTLQVKKGKVRFDLPQDLIKQARLTGNAYGVIDTSGGKLDAVIDDRKTIVEVDFKKLSEQVKAMAPHDPTRPKADKPSIPPKITKTGHMDKVAGYACEDWQIVTSDGDKATVCVTTTGSTWFKIPSLTLPAEAQWAAEFLDGKHFPVRMIGFDKTGAEEGRVELSQLDKHPIPDSIFQMPPGYQRLDVQQFVQSMMNGAGAGAGVGSGAPGTLPPGVTITPQMQETLKRLQAQSKKGAH